MAVTRRARLSDTPIEIPEIDDLIATLRLLARLTPPLESARNISAEEAARAIHGAMEEASRETVRLLRTRHAISAARRRAAAGLFSSFVRELDV